MDQIGKSSLLSRLSLFWLLSIGTSGTTFSTWRDVHGTLNLHGNNDDEPPLSEINRQIFLLIISNPSSPPSMPPIIPDFSIGDRGSLANLLFRYGVWGMG